MAGTVVENDELELTLDDELDTMGPGDPENDKEIVSSVTKDGE